METRSKSKEFLQASASKSFDLKHRKTIRFNMARYDLAVSRGRARYKSLVLPKERAQWIKDQVLSDWDNYLKRFEANLIARGVDVHWAENGDEALEICQKLFEAEGIELVVKSKSMVTEEIGFNEHFAERGLEVIETDLGEFIVQVAGEKPYHIVTPAMHKSKEDVAELFHEQFGMDKSSSPAQMTLFVRDRLRAAFQKAGAGVTGANFLIADPGVVCLTENEGNGLMSTAFARVHIVIAGIEKILPDLNALHHFWPWLALHGTGQQISVYNSMFFGPGKASEGPGPEKLVVILLDNGRSRLFESPDMFTALRCIRCGACLNACPVYRNIGGYTYSTTYSGPIGSVISPYLCDFQDHIHLSFASSLCGACKEVCPVGIDLPGLLLRNRKEAIIKGTRPVAERIAFRAFSLAAWHRKLFDLGSPKLRNMLVQKLIGSRLWGSLRLFPQFKPSFASQWKGAKHP